MRRPVFDGVAAGNPTFLKELPPSGTMEIVYDWWPKRVVPRGAVS